MPNLRKDLDLKSRTEDNFLTIYVKVHHWALTETIIVKNSLSIAFLDIRFLYNAQYLTCAKIDHP